MSWPPADERDLLIPFVPLEDSGVMAMLRDDLVQRLLPEGRRRLPWLIRDLLSSAREAVFFRGRGVVVALRIPGGPERMVIRHFSHGGALRHLTRDLFWQWPPRPFRELLLSEKIRLAGVPTPEVLGAIVRRIGPLLYKGDIITREIAGTRTMADFFKEQTDPLLRRRGLLEIADAVVRLHRAGVAHPDLNARNILLSGDEILSAHLVDLDGARQHPVLGMDRAKESLLRLARSLDKEGVPLTERERLRFLRAYLGEDFREVYLEEFAGIDACRQRMEELSDH